MYLAPVILKGILSDIFYDHFMNFHVATKILSKKKFCSFLDMILFCEGLLKSFVDNSSKLYGSQFKSYNVHNLIHLPMNVQKLGTLENFSAYSFENHLQVIKNMVRKSALPLHQIVKRLGEKQNNLWNCKEKDTPMNVIMSLSEEHDDGPLLTLSNVKQFAFGKFRHWNLSRKFPNNVVLFKDGTAGFIENFIQKGTEIMLLCKKYQSATDFFSFPIASHKIGTVKVGTLLDLQCFPLSSVECKAIRMPIANGKYVVSALM